MRNERAVIALFALSCVPFLGREIDWKVARAQRFLFGACSLLLFRMLWLLWRRRELYIELPSLISVFPVLDCPRKNIMLVLHPPLLEFFIRASSSTQALVASCPEWDRHYIVSCVFAIVFYDKVVFSQLYWLEMATHRLLRDQRRLYVSLLALGA